jgi:hypothetical protein
MAGPTLVAAELARPVASPSAAAESIARALRKFDLAQAATTRDSSAPRAISASIEYRCATIASLGPKSTVAAMHASAWLSDTAGGALVSFACAAFQRRARSSMRNSMAGFKMLNCSAEFLAGSEGWLTIRCEKPF